MPESIDERLSDLERLVLRQSERIAALEEQLDAAQRIAVSRAVRALRPPQDEAA